MGIDAVGRLLQDSSVRTRVRGRTTIIHLKDAHAALIEIGSNEIGLLGIDGFRAGDGYTLPLDWIADWSSLCGSDKRVEESLVASSKFIDELMEEFVGYPDVYVEFVLDSTTFPAWFRSET